MSKQHIPDAAQWPASNPVTVPIERLVPYARNARLHSDEQVEQIAASIRQWGWTTPVLVDENGVIIAGHGRVMAAQRLGLPAVPCIVARGWSEAQRRAYAIADNALTIAGTWDDALLKVEVAELSAAGFDVALTGLADTDIAALLGAERAPKDDKPGQPPVETPRVARPGDLWILGDHRLLCGDSTSAADVARVMNGERARLLATDPPYFVGHSGKAGRLKGACDYEAADRREDGQHWDDETTDGGQAFHEAWIRAALPHLDERAVVYQWHAVLRADAVLRAWRASGLLPHQMLVWVKSKPILGRTSFMWAHEPCLYGWPPRTMLRADYADGHGLAAFGWREGFKPSKRRRPPPGDSTVWHIEPDPSLKSHPTQKPVELFAKPIRYHTERGEVVLEPFSGSGTQIIAAERLARRCFAIEQNPRYVDVALWRWRTETQRMPVLATTGETHDQVAEARGAFDDWDIINGRNIGDEA